MKLPRVLVDKPGWAAMTGVLTLLPYNLINGGQVDCLATSRRLSPLAGCFWPFQTAAGREANGFLGNATADNRIH